MSLDSCAPIPTGLTLFLYPDRIWEGYYWHHLMKHVGWYETLSPEQADWRVLHRDATWVTLRDDDPRAADAHTWLNGRCRDISKDLVHRVHERVFGYSPAVDPLAFTGRMLRKTRANSDKSGYRIFDGPVSPADLDRRYVWERLLLSDAPPLGPIDYRAWVVGGQVVALRRKEKRDWHVHGEHDRTNLDLAVVEITTVLTDAERGLISDFCFAVGLDLGALELIRDNVDGRLYVLDVTTTPGGRAWPAHLVRQERYISEQIARALLATFPPARTVR